MALTTSLPLSDGEYFALPQSDYVENRVLAAGTEENFAPPAGAQFALFAASDDFWMKFNGTAAAPAVDTTDGSGSEFNPTMRKLLLAGAAVTKISVISENGCKMSVSYFMK